MSLTLTGYSTALYATWWFVEEWGLLFDCGDGASAALGQKGRKVKTIAFSHADRDHLAGIVNFLQLNGQGERPRILYPADCGSFPALADFSKRFDPHQEGRPEWVPVRVGETHAIGKGRYLEVLPNEHIVAEDGICKSVSYKVIEKRRHLLEEHRALPGPEIGALKKRLGEEAVTEERVRPLLGFSGDAASPNAALWADVPCVIHEATFLEGAQTDELAMKHRHCRLPDVLTMAAELDLESLVVGHFSTRYSHDQIQEAIEHERGRSGFEGKVLAVLPGMKESLSL